MDGNNPRLAARNRRFAAVERKERDAPPRLWAARQTAPVRVVGRGGNEGGAFGHAQRLIDRFAGPLGPLRPHACRHRFPGGERVAETGEAVKARVRLQELPVNSRRGRENRRAEMLRELRPDAGIARPCVDQGGGAHGPGVHQPGAERIGPVERPGVEHDVLTGQPVPALPHHPPRPRRPVRMGDALGAPGRAGRVDDIGEVVGGCVGEAVHGRARRVAGRDLTNRRAFECEARGGEDQLRVRLLRDISRLIGAEQGGGRDGDGAHRRCAEEKDREIGGMPDPQHHPLARLQAERRQPARRRRNAVAEVPIG